jgi:hypothetical protein
MECDFIEPSTNIFLNMRIKYYNTSGMVSKNKIILCGCFNLIEAKFVIKNNVQQAL